MESSDWDCSETREKLFGRCWPTANQQHGLVTGWLEQTFVLDRWMVFQVAISVYAWVTLSFIKLLNTLVQLTTFSTSVELIGFSPFFIISTFYLWEKWRDKDYYWRCARLYYISFCELQTFRQSGHLHGGVYFLIVQVVSNPFSSIAMGGKLSWDPGYTKCCSICVCDKWQVLKVIYLLAEITFFYIKFSLSTHVKRAVFVQNLNWCSTA